MKKYKLDPEEQEIQDALKKGVLNPIDNTEEEMARLIKSATLTLGRLAKQSQKSTCPHPEVCKCGDSNPFHRHKNCTHCGQRD